MRNLYPHRNEKSKSKIKNQTEDAPDVLLKEHTKCAYEANIMYFVGDPSHVYSILLVFGKHHKHLDSKYIHLDETCTKQGSSEELPCFVFDGDMRFLGS